MVVSDYNNNHDNDVDDTGSISGCSSLERALSDIEIVRSAYPDETSLSIQNSATTPTSTGSVNIDDIVRHNDNDNNNNDTNEVHNFPLHVILYLSKQIPVAYIVLEYNDGYPIDTPIRISVYRDNTPGNHQQRIEHTVRTVRKIAQECFENGIEAGLACCSVALETWNTYHAGNDKNTDTTDDTDTTEIVSSSNLPILSQHPDEIIGIITTATIPSIRQYEWYTSTASMIQDRKSIFVGHCCTIQKESDVSLAIQQLIQSNNKLQRATHQMVCSFILLTCTSFLFTSSMFLLSFIIHSTVSLHRFLFYIYIHKNFKIEIMNSMPIDLPKKRLFKIVRIVQLHRQYL
jgi:hypothetical protein